MNELKTLISQVKAGDWEAIKDSKLLFVRSQDHLAVHDSNANGRVLTAFETATYYPDKLMEVLEYGVASLPCLRDEPADTIRSARESFGISIEELARYTQVPEETIRDAENSNSRTPILELQKIAHALDIDDAQLSINPKSDNHSFGYRLRTFSDDNTIEKKDVMAFAEAAWVAQTQLKLESWLGFTADYPLCLFEKNPEYGNPNYRAWRIGYELAEKARELLEVDQDHVFLRETCEKLGIPVIQTELSENIAGATLSVAGMRAIVVANDRRHDDVLIRRMTIAHELGHLLWDTEENLNDIRVDTFDHIGENPQFMNTVDDHDRYVEQRANAFAVHFIGPIDHKFATGITDDTELVVNAVEKFGFSVTSATYHLANRLGRNVTPQRINDESLDRGSWDGKESFGIDLFPISNVPVSRRGLFSYRVAKCYKEKLITISTASSYMKCSEEDFLRNVDLLTGMFE
ncbi:ImmA/IrrE family metallo-endopeptidase [Pseudodesulfovibrio methanolicus]|uniref:Helix-turn-helix domain-containing protein n=1 Tax=Pseudodesulfovibrio methanolicus TaxID=3126690 RepID=A0ABZ2J386_9BACT